MVFHSLIHKKRAFALILAALVLAWPMVSHAADGKAISSHGQWTAYETGSSAKKTCFISSEPTKLKGDYNRNNRDQTRVYVTHGPKKSDRDVVSSFAGYRFKDQEDVFFNIDGRKFTLYSSDSYAWATPDLDQILVKEMKRGRSLTVTGVSSRGNTTIDIYSLTGFTAAYNVIGKSCPK